MDLSNFGENSFMDSNYLSQHKSFIFKDSIDYLGFAQPSFLLLILFKLYN